MLGLLWVGVALAGPAGDLAAAAGGMPIVAMRCDRASRVVGDEGQFGFGVVGNMAGEDARRIFDIEKPLTLVMVSDEAGSMKLAVEGGVIDPGTLAERIADPEFQAQLAPGAVITQVGERLRLMLPQGEGAVPSGQPVVARVDGPEEAGCVVAVDAQALFGLSPPPIPLAERIQVIVARMADPRGEHRITLEMADVPPEIGLVLDGDGPLGLLGATSTVVFPTVLQVHGSLGEVLRALPEVSQGPITAVAASLADDIEGRLVGAPGLLIALGGADEGGAIVLPMERPKGAGKLKKVLVRVGKEIGADVTKLPGGLLAVGIAGRPALTAGAKKGLVVVALREDVVRDVLSGTGTAWLPAPTSAYGLRLLGSDGGLLGGFDGYVEARYTDGAMQVLVVPAE